MSVLEPQLIIDWLNAYFPPEWLRAALVLSIISTWVLVGLFAYLNQYTQRRYFSLWTTAWLFYALWLTASINSLDSPESKLGVMLTQSCIGICALFLFWGNVSILRHTVPQWNIVGGMLMVLLWSYIAIYQLSNKFWLQLPLFAMLGASGIFTSYLFFARRRERRYIGASILSVGFLLWGVYLVAYPFLYSKAEFAPSGFLLSATLQLIIAFGMIVLVLEEVRYESRTVRARLRQDVKRTRVLEREVVATEDKYRTLFNNASDAILIVDRETLGILETNEAASKMLALKPEELIIRGLFDICPTLSAHRKLLTEDAEAFCKTLDSTERLHLPRPDGTFAIAEGRALPVQYAGRPSVQICFRDLTEREKLEQHLRQSEKLSALGQLISGVAHELNNPLSVVMGRAQLLMTHGDLDAKTKTDLLVVNHESERATRIVRRLLAFARPQPLEKQHMQINDSVVHVMELVKVDDAQQPVQWVIELEPSLPQTMADTHQIEQVLMNLVQNAKHALLERKDAAGGIIRLHSESDGKMVRVSVSDNGPGIPPQNLGKIFDPFFTTKASGFGTGLGLSICYSTIKEHDGNLLVQSEPGKGATFTIELPIIAAPAPSSEPKLQPGQPAQPQSGSQPLELIAEAKHDEGNGNGHKNGTNGKSVHAPSQKARILLVDDEPAIAGVLSELLTCCDYEVESAGNGQQALNRLKTERFDLIISDLKMPGMDGRELYRQLKQLNPKLTRRIIFLTGDTVSGDTREFLDELKTPWLSKPFNISEVEDTVRKSLATAV